jgi:hypothetical protein
LLGNLAAAFNEADGFLFRIPAAATGSRLGQRASTARLIASLRYGSRDASRFAR